MSTTQLEIRGMSCAACVAHVEKALRGVPGVRSARVDLQQERATVEHDNAEESRLIEAVAEAGYQASRAS